jgi:DNA gyrase/topoisomerase IV subunit B
MATAAKSSDAKKYSADDIEVLEGLEAVRRRPSMYIGGVDIRGLHHLLWEIVDNSVDEYLANEADTIVVTLHKEVRRAVSKTTVVGFRSTSTPRPRSLPWN